MDEEFIEEIFTALRLLYRRYVGAYHNHLDGHQTLPAEFCKAQSEVVQESARAIAYSQGLDVPAWALELEEVETCL